jgi:hypothetical protein
VTTGKKPGSRWDISPSVRRALDFGVNLLLGFGILLCAAGFLVKYGLKEGSLGSLAASWNSPHVAPAIAPVAPAPQAPAAAPRVVQAVEAPKRAPAVTPKIAQAVEAPKPAPAPKPAVSVKTIVYQDTFARNGHLDGSKPTSGAATWTSSTDPGDYILNGHELELKSSAYPYSAVYLPVNGATGITLDGSKDFTLSVVVTPGGTGRTGISLNTGTMGRLSNLFSVPFAALSMSQGCSAYVFGGGNISYSYTPGGFDQPAVVSISYKASTKTLVYTVGAATVYTQTGVTAEEVAAIRDVAVGNEGYGIGAAAAPPKFSNFTLTVG